MQKKTKIKCIAVFTSQNKLNGYVTFTEDNKKVIIDVNLSGLAPGNHGIHIHEAGNLLDGCKSCCAHFNPDNTTHGGPNDLPNQRHAGDLGNITANCRFLKNGKVFLSSLGKLLFLNQIRSHNFFKFFIYCYRNIFDLILQTCSFYCFKIV